MLWLDDSATGGERIAEVQFHPVFDGALDGSVEIRVWQSGWSKPVVADATLTDGGWRLPLHDVLDPEQLAAPAFVRPAGWSDGFLVDFAHPRSSTSALVEAMPSSHRTTVEGRPVIDPADVASPMPGTVLDALTTGPLPAGFNASPYVSDDVHAAYPLFGQLVPTATGKSWTWLVQPPVAPIKDIYTCFESRDPAQEAALGVPSGAGWHRIGDPAESLVNSLEEVAIPVAFARGDEPPPAPAGGYAYQLTAVATYRLLQPGEAFTVNAPDYHGYLMPHDEPACAQILVHPASMP